MLIYQFSFTLRICFCCSYCERGRRGFITVAFNLLNWPECCKPKAQQLTQTTSWLNARFSMRTCWVSGPERGKAISFRRWSFYLFLVLIETPDQLIDLISSKPCTQIHFETNEKHKIVAYINPIFSGSSSIIWLSRYLPSRLFRR